MSLCVGLQPLINGMHIITGFYPVLLCIALSELETRYVVLYKIQIGLKSRYIINYQLLIFLIA